MSMVVLGLNHRTAPVDVRERLAFSREGAGNALILFRRMFPDAEAAILSTCNRVELMVASPDKRPNLDDAVSFLAQARDIEVTSFRPHLYELSDRGYVPMKDRSHRHAKGLRLAPQPVTLICGGV